MKDELGIVSQRSFTKRRAIKAMRRARYIGIPEVTIDSVLEDAVEGGLVTDIVRCINAGKEADIYLALWKDDPIILKVYRLHHTPHRKRSLLGYAQDIVTYWAAREFWLMQRAYWLGIPVPTPARRVDNMLTMRYLSEDGLPAPMLKDCHPEDPEKVLEEILGSVSKLYENYIVHGDISKFNILIHQGQPFLIDFPQALDFSSRRTRKRDSQNAETLLLRDLTNVSDYFSDFEIECDPQGLLRQITANLPEDWPDRKWTPP